MFAELLFKMLQIIEDAVQILIELVHCETLRIISFISPISGTAWMTWALFGCLLFCFPLLLFFKEEYRRLMVDKTPAIEDYTKCEDDFEHIPSTSASGE